MGAMGTMDLRRAFFSRGMKLLRHPTVSRLLADPRAMDLFVAGVRGKARIDEVVDGALSPLMAEARRRLARLTGK